jgi:hypothetical protein
MKKQVEKVFFVLEKKMSTRQYKGLLDTRKYGSVVNLIYDEKKEKYFLALTSSGFFKYLTFELFQTQMLNVKFLTKQQFIEGTGPLATQTTEFNSLITPDGRFDIVLTVEEGGYYDWEWSQPFRLLQVQN